MSMVGGSIANNKYPGHVRLATVINCNSYFERCKLEKKVQIWVETRSGHLGQAGLTRFIKSRFYTGSCVNVGLWS